MFESLRKALCCREVLVLLGEVDVWLNCAKRLYFWCSGEGLRVKPGDAWVGYIKAASMIQGVSDSAYLRRDDSYAGFLMRQPDSSCREASLLV